MNHLIENLNEDELNILSKYDKNDILKALEQIKHIKNRRNIYHQNYYNKIKSDDEKINKLKTERKVYYNNIKNDETKYKEYLNKMKEYNRNYLLRLKENGTYDQIKKKKNIIDNDFIINDQEMFIIDIKKFIEKFNEFQTVNNKVKQLIIMKSDLNDDEIFLIDSNIDNEKLKIYLISKFSNFLKLKNS